MYITNFTRHQDMEVYNIPDLLISGSCVQRHEIVVSYHLQHIDIQKVQTVFPGFYLSRHGGVVCAVGKVEDLIYTLLSLQVNLARQ